MREVEIRVFGKPVSQGSHKAMKHPRTNRIMVFDDSARTKIWRNSIACEARIKWREEPTKEPIQLGVAFYFKRPKSRKPGPHQTKPDLDKLCRCVLDALTGIVYEDDKQVGFLVASKHYHPDGRDGAIISCKPMPSDSY